MHEKKNLKFPPLVERYRNGMCKVRVKNLATEKVSHPPNFHIFSFGPVYLNRTPTVSWKIWLVVEVHNVKPV